MTRPDKLVFNPRYAYINDINEAINFLLDRELELQGQMDALLSELAALKAKPAVAAPAAPRGRPRKKA